MWMEVYLWHSVFRQLHIFLLITGYHFSSMGGENLKINLEQLLLSNFILEDSFYGLILSCGDGSTGMIGWGWECGMRAWG